MEKNPRFQGFCCTSALNTFICNQLQITGTFLKNPLKVADLRCEYRINPVGLDVVHPRMSWILLSAERGQKQSAYQILAASSAEALARDEADLWDSGRLDSD